MIVIKVLIVDDHPAVGEGTRAIIDQEDDMQANVIADSEKYLEAISKEIQMQSSSFILVLTSWHTITY